MELASAHLVADVLRGMRSAGGVVVQAQTVVALQSLLDPGVGMTIPETAGVLAPAREISPYMKRKADALRRQFARVADMIERAPHAEGQPLADALEDLLSGLLDGRHSFSAAAFHASGLAIARQAYPGERDRVEREGTAYHEASHATIATVHSITVRKCTIVGPISGLSLGHVELETYSPTDAAWDDPARLVIERYAMVDLAGCAAEDQAGLGAPRESWDVHRADARRTLLPIRPFPGEPALSAHVAYLEARTRALVAANWPAIEAVADALRLKDTLTGDEVREIVARAERRLS